MCLNTGLNSAEILGVIKKLDPTFKKNFEAKKASESKSDAVTKSVTRNSPTKKQKRRLRPNTLMRSSPGRRSFLEGK